MGLFNFQKHNKNTEQQNINAELAELLDSENDNENAPTAEVTEKPSTEKVVEIGFDTKLLTLAPRPSTLNETGLSVSLLLDLLVKHLQVGGVYTLRELAEKLALSGGAVQELLDQAKGLSWVENRQSSAEGQMRYALSHLGDMQADKAFLKNGYLGKAPVPLAQYLQVAKIQSNRSAPLSKAELDKVFAELTFPAELLERIGPALNSTKPILIYGNPGTGKSYFCRHLNLVFGEQVLIPYALEVNNEIIQIFDPEVHQTNYQSNNTDLLKLTSSFDQRWQLCQRPLIVTGGELTLDMLEVRFDHNSRTYQAPLQLKANNGILLLDDLGRQQVSPKALFNRWIVPLEERRDFLSLQSGQHFAVPFELLMLFSTNLSPKELIDEAFLRRLGYKIPFTGLNKVQFKAIWDQECAANGLACENTQFEYLVEQLLLVNNKEFLPCYPRDLLAIINDQIVFKSLKPEIDQALLDFAWQSYFV